MLPGIRTEGDIYEIPKVDLERNDVQSFLATLKGFHAELRDCFAREEGRDNFFLIWNQLEQQETQP